MNKKLDEVAMQSELAGSAFFVQAVGPVEGPPPSTSGPVLPAAKTVRPPRPPRSPASATRKPPSKLVMPDRAEDRPSSQTSLPSSHDASTIEQLRKAVKTAGKEVSFVRMTAEEKRQLQDVVYTYRRQGVKTSENEIGRIAMSWLLADYQANGENSVLASVIAALQA